MTLPGVSAMSRPTANLRHVGLAQLQVAVAGHDVLGQHFHAAHQVFAAGGDRFAVELRIGGDEVGRRKGAR